MIATKADMFRRNVLPQCCMRARCARARITMYGYIPWRSVSSPSMCILLRRLCILMYIYIFTNSCTFCSLIAQVNENRRCPHKSFEIFLLKCFAWGNIVMYQCIKYSYILRFSLGCLKLFRYHSHHVFTCGSQGVVSYCGSKISVI